MKHQKAATLLMLAGYVLCLLQVWLPAYFVTGDGPCHLYNARVLHDLWANRDADFYGRFYTGLFRPNPNWLTHLGLAGLMCLVQGVVAEKLLLTAYVLLFVSGFSILLRRLDSKSVYWPLAVFVFVFHYIFSKGFYNFSFSFALLFWVIEVWLRYLEGRRVRTAVWFAVLAVVTFFTHPVAFVFGAFSCFALTVSHAVAGDIVADSPGRLKLILGKACVLLLCLLPGFISLVWFMGGDCSGLKLHFYRYRFNEFGGLNCLINVSTREVAMIGWVGWVLLGLFIMAILTRLGKRMRIRKQDGLLAGMAFAAALYLLFPDKLFGGSLFVVRMQLLVLVFALLCTGYMLAWVRMKNLGGIALFACFVSLSITRMDVRATAAEGVADILSASKYIKPYSVLLPLDFSPAGRDVRGRVIADGNWPFVHAWQYMGIEKPLILLDNYEANTGYFPLVWKDGVNPYMWLGAGGSVEAQPPHAGINEYRDKTGVVIDYVLLWCYEPKWLADEGFRKLYDEIRDGYMEVYRSLSGRTILYRRM